MSMPASSAGQVGEAQAVLQHGDGEQAEQGAAHGAAAAEDRRAAEHDGGDREQLVAGARVGLRLAEAGDVDRRAARPAASPESR